MCDLKPYAGNTCKEAELTGPHCYPECALACPMTLNVISRLQLSVVMWLKGFAKSADDFGDPHNISGDPLWTADWVYILNAAALLTSGLRSRTR